VCFMSWGRVGRIASAMRLNLEAVKAGVRDAQDHDSGRMQMVALLQNWEGRCIISSVQGDDTSMKVF